MDKKIADFGQFLGEKTDFVGAGKDFGVEKSSGKKSWKNWEKSAIFCQFFRKGPIFADFSANDVHALWRRVRAAIIVDLLTINSKNRRFFGFFSAFFREFFLNYSGPWIFFCF